MIVMTPKIFVLLCVIGFAGICIAQDQSPSPGEPSAKEPTKRAHKKAETTASEAETAASPSEAASPAASPKAKRAHKQAEAATAANPAASPAASPKGKHAHAKAGAVAVASPSASASPAKFNLGDMFKPKTSTAAASPAAAAPASAKGTSAKAATKAPAPGGGHGLVWVNTESHVYHKEGSRFYGTTKNGKYMTEAEAVKAGNKAGAERH